MFTPMSAEIAGGPLVASVVCATVGGTYITVIVSVLNVPAGSSWFVPCRYGSIGAK